MYLIDENTELFKDLLEQLIQAESIKYLEWNPNNDNSELDTQAGIYHFYKVSDDTCHSLYVGKAGFAYNYNWSLFQRLKQHFQPSQKNTLLGKYADRCQVTTEQAKRDLESSEVYLQWLPMFIKDGENRVETIVQQFSIENFERKIVWTECFCKSILQPEYTDA